MLDFRCKIVELNEFGLRKSRNLQSKSEITSLRVAVVSI